MEQKNEGQVADRIVITYYTDPLCCWSWGFERHWQQLKELLGDRLDVRYCMGGMLETWDGYNDTLNSVSKPIQMGPLWMQASHICGVPMNGHIWVSDPPSSSYLACIAVKCAFFQSHVLGEKYLYAIRQALMDRGENIAKQSTLLNVARQIAATLTDFDYNRFEGDLVNGNGLDAFKADLQEVRYKNITRFPTLLISCNNRATLLTGFRKYESVVETINKLETVTNS